MPLPESTNTIGFFEPLPSAVPAISHTFEPFTTPARPRNPVLPKVMRVVQVAPLKVISECRRPPPAPQGSPWTNRFVGKEAGFVGWVARLLAKARRMVVMRRPHFKLVVDIVLLVAAFLTFASGLVLFIDLHRDMGALRTSALGLSRLAWLNLHRIPALMVVSAVVLHLALNWAAFLARLRNGFSRKSKSRGIPELVLYGTFWTVALTGIAAWFFVAGSAPLAGPVPLAWLHHTRHHVIEIHHSVGFVVLSLAAHHVGHRAHRIVRDLASWVHCNHAANQS